LTASFFFSRASLIYYFSLTTSAGTGASDGLSVAFSSFDGADFSSGAGAAFGATGGSGVAVALLLTGAASVAAEGFSFAATSASYLLAFSLAASRA